MGLKLFKNGNVYKKFKENYFELYFQKGTTFEKVTSVLENTQRYKNDKKLVQEGLVNSFILKVKFEKKPFAKGY